MSTLKVNTIRHTGASSDAVTLASDGSCTADITNLPPGNRNLIINGAMQVAQRGTTTTNSGYYTLDRFKMQSGGKDANMTTAQHSLTSSDTGPWAKGFRKSFHITNGDQTSGAGGDDFVEIYQYIEDQNISNSGWDYTSSSSKLTISFWVKSSVSDKFYGFLYTNQAGAGDSKMYSYAIDNGSGGSLAANTWTKITHTVPGDSSLTFNNDNTNGLGFGIIIFNGVNMTTPGHTLNTWTAWDSADKIPDISNTWWNTDDATFEITGVQLEVSDHATEFEHRSYGDELARCQRYFLKRIYTDSIGPYFCQYIDTHRFAHEFFPCTMRTAPSITATFTRSSTAYKTSQDHAKFYTDLAYNSSTQANMSSAEYSAEL